METLGCGTGDQFARASGVAAASARDLIRGLQSAYRVGSCGLRKRSVMKIRSDLRRELPPFVHILSTPLTICLQLSSNSHNSGYGTD